MEAGTPAVRNADAPSEAEVGKHVASGHANFRRWCPDCQKGLAMRKPHRTKTKEQYNRNKDGEIDVAETEEAKSGWTTFSIDYMVVDDDSEEKAGATMVMV